MDNKTAVKSSIMKNKFYDTFNKMRELSTDGKRSNYEIRLDPSTILVNP
jgi:phage major head subunit gpT-like protein